MPPLDLQPTWPRPRALYEAMPARAGETVDFAIVGGGILGLTAALHAARRGLSVRVIDARRIGEGASGLNGGQVIPGLKLDPDALAAHVGERGEQAAAFAATTADRVFETIEREGLDVPRSRAGWIQAAHTEAALDLLEARNRQWRARGADVRMIGEYGIVERTGARGYKGGWLDLRAGQIDPLAYTLELARVASAMGVKIAENQAVTALRRDGAGWRVAIGAAEIRATSVLVATNGYTDRLIPGLAQSIVPLQSFQIATAPLDEATLAGILPGGQAVSDSRHILVYHRRTPDGRIALGGRGRMGEPSAPRHWAHLRRALVRLYPQLKKTPIERRWFGRLAVTTDHLPHIHEPETGLVTAVGCQGRGVALMTALGPLLVDYLIDRDARVLPLPLSPIQPIPFHRFRQIGVAAAIAWYRARDAFER